MNILVHAVNRDAPRHERARMWWDERPSELAPVCLAWVTVLGFVRSTTNPRVLPKPLTVDEAGGFVSSWLQQPCVRIIEPLEGHWGRVERLPRAAGTGGNLTTDAHLAALAMEHGYLVFSTDADFGRFPGFRWRNPLLDGSPDPGR